MGRDILKSSLENASFSIVFQILFRCVTFVLNAFIIRHVGQEVLGIMNVRLLLLESTILFLSREPLLKACLTDTKSHNWAQVINQVWLSVPISGLLSIGLVYVWLNLLSSTEDKYLEQYQIGCYAIAVSCIIDQITQCLVLVAQSYCFVRLKIICETLYITIRTITFVFLVLHYPNHAINAFSIAQVTSAIVLCTLYYGFFYWYINNFNKLREHQKKDDTITLHNEVETALFKDMQDFKFTSILDFFPGYMDNKVEENLKLNAEILSISRDVPVLLSRYKTAQPADIKTCCVVGFLFFVYGLKELVKSKCNPNTAAAGSVTQEKPFNKDLTVLSVSFAKQSVVKQVLTEGERYVMTISPVLTFSEQSMYDIVNNLGSLAARFIFRPIEDSAYFYFTQMIKRDQPIDKQDQRQISEAVTVLSQLCKVVSSIGLVVIVFGNAYSHTLLYLYGGNTLISTKLPTILLKCHCVAVLLLAVNGVTECYVFATMNSKQLDRYNYIMVIFSITFLLVSYIFTTLFGPVGFIFANCINMAARIMHSVYFITNKYKESSYHPLEGLRPGTKFISVLIVSGIITNISEKYYLLNVNMRAVIIHVGIGGICFITTIATWIFENKSLTRTGINQYKRRVSLKND